MRPAKIILIGLLAMLGLALAAVMVVIALIDPNRFKPQIAVAVREATGQELRLSGDIDVAWMPWLALRTGAGELTSASGLPLARWEEARLGARLLPLLRGRLELDRLQLSGLDLRLRRDVAGRGNWSDLLGASAQPGGGSGLRSIAGVDLEHSRVSYETTQGEVFALEDWHFEASAWRPGQPVQFKTRFGLRLGGAQGAHALAMRGAALTPSEGSAALLRDLALEALVRRDGRQMTLALATPQIEIDAAAGRYLADRATLSIDRSEIALRAVRIVQAEAGLRASAGAAIAPTSLRDLLIGLGIEEPRTTDPTALENFSATVGLRYDAGAWRLEPFDAQLDGMPLRGWVRSGTAGAPLEFELVGKSMDLARYLPPDDPADEPFELPVEDLRALQARGVLRLDAATFGDYTLKDVTLRLVLDAGRLRTEPRS